MDALNQSAVEIHFLRLLVKLANRRQPRFLLARTKMAKITTMPAAIAIQFWASNTRGDPIAEIVAKKIIEIGTRGIRDPDEISAVAINELIIR